MRRTIAVTALMAAVTTLALPSVPSAAALAAPAASPEAADRNTAPVAPSARPTDGDRDKRGDGYNPSSTVRRKCSKFLCLHWVTKAGDPDKPPAGWPDTTLTQLNRTWRKEVQQMGFRKPLKDGTRGGNGKLDFYLKDIGWKGQDGYCDTDRQRYVTSGYCVLDNDFLDPELEAAAPLGRLKVTAARELFHVIQFAYDAGEDLWLKDSTARWMEERVADGVNDNHRYLLDGQLGAPSQSLDTSAEGGPDQYGNWLFWEYLTQRKGNGLVKRVWEKAAAYKGAPDQYSTQALKTVLKTKGGLKGNFAAYASALTMPSKFWAEGATLPAGDPITNSHTMSTTTTSVGDSVGVSHLASRNVRFTPNSSLAAAYRLKITVDGPWSKAAPVAYLLTEKTDGRVIRQVIKLNNQGKGSTTVWFSNAGTANVTLTLVNASTRFTCWRGTQFSCKGLPRDENKPFSYTAQLLAPTP